MTTLSVADALAEAANIATRRAQELREAAINSGRRHFDEEAYEVQGIANAIREYAATLSRSSENRNG